MTQAVKRRLLVGLLAATLLQLSVLGGELVAAAYPRWTGTPIRVAVQPVDPRDLFRGNYARLNYAFSMVDVALWRDGQAPIPGQRVYVSLEQDDAGAWQASGMSGNRPDRGMFLRGRYRYAMTGMRDVDTALQWGRPRVDSYRVEYGIEAWFAPKDQAQAVERQLRRHDVYAQVFVAGNGKASLAGLEVVDGHAGGRSTE